MCGRFRTCIFYSDLYPRRYSHQGPVSQTKGMCIYMRTREVLLKHMFRVKIRPLAWPFQMVLRVLNTSLNMLRRILSHRENLLTVSRVYRVDQRATFDFINDFFSKTLFERGTAPAAPNNFSFRVYIGCAVDNN